MLDPNTGVQIIGHNGLDDEQIAVENMAWSCMHFGNCKQSCLDELFWADLISQPPPYRLSGQATTVTGAQIHAPQLPSSKKSTTSNSNCPMTLDSQALALSINASIST